MTSQDPDLTTIKLSNIPASSHVLADVHLLPKKPHVRKISEIWTQYREVYGGNAVECIHCLKLLRRSDSSTKNMWGHMRSFHREQFQTLPREQAKWADIDRVISGQLLPDIKTEPEANPGRSGDSRLMDLFETTGSYCKRLKQEEEFQMKTPKIEEEDLFEEKTPTQPYVKRARGVGGNQNPNVFFPDNLNMALHNLHNNMHNRQSNEEMSAHPSFAFLDSIPKINEVINISAGFNAHHSHTDEDSEHNDLGNEPSSSAASEGDDGHQTPSIGYCGHASDSEPQTQVPTSQLSDSPSSTHVPFIGGNHAANFLGKPSEIPVSSSPFSLLTMVNNPILYMNALTSLASSTNGQTPMLSAEVLQQTLRGVISQESTVSATENNALRPPSQQPLDAQGCAFSLQDPRCMTSLMKMTLDLDLTLSYHRRRGDVEWCFESNRTAEKSGGRGKVLCLSDLGKEIRVSERSNGNVTESELWTKTDFTQFQWAIRGKCQKALLK